MAVWPEDAPSHSKNGQKAQTTRKPSGKSIRSAISRGHRAGKISTAPILQSPYRKYLSIKVCTVQTGIFLKSCSLVPSYVQLQLTGFIINHQRVQPCGRHTARHNGVSPRVYSSIFLRFRPFCPAPYYWQVYYARSINNSSNTYYLLGAYQVAGTARHFLFIISFNSLSSGTIKVSTMIPIFESELRDSERLKRLTILLAPNEACSRGCVQVNLLSQCWCLPSHCWEVVSEALNSDKTRILTSPLSPCSTRR